MGKMYHKLALCGGEGGREWDDGVYEGVKKVYVGQDLSRITYIKFEYVKEDGEVVTHEYGTITQDPQEFIVEYPDEHITSVEGSYNKVALIATEVITSLVFKTSKGRTSPTFGPNLFGVVNGTKFKLEEEGTKIVGFHGRSDNAVDALGVYLLLGSLDMPFPMYKLEAQGGKDGSVWDDGTFQGVKTVRVCQDDSRITYLEFEYFRGASFQTRHHGVKGETQSEFVINFLNEHITSVEATYDNPKFFRNTVITSLKFETSEGRTASFGYEVGKKFVLGQNGSRLVGFHGKEGEAIDALGAYFEHIPLPTPPPEIGEPWGDYGIYDSVKKITIGLYEEGIAFLKFVYRTRNGLVTGDDHGKITSLGAEEIVLEDGEYLTGVEGYFKPIVGAPFPKFVSIKFKTNKRETPLYGSDSGEKYSYGEKGHKIVGFSGRATDVIYTVEPYSRPI